MVSTKAIKKKLKSKPKAKDRPRVEEGLSSGTTLLNLACTGNYKAAFLKGCYYLIVGDSSSGKTLLVLSTLAEAAADPNYANYDLIYDPIEGGALFDMQAFFGKKLAKRLRKPLHDTSATVEELYYNIDDSLQNWRKTKRPFIYIVDSMDSLIAKEDEEHFKKVKEAKRSGKEVKGTYGVSKAKTNSKMLARLMAPLKESGSILLIICQTRDSFGMFEEQTRAGGKALKFYATIEIWLKRGKAILKAYKGMKVPIGVNSLMKVKKNRVQGKNRTVSVPIYEQFKGGGGGIDDVGGLVDYLIKWKHFDKRGKKITAEEFDFEGTKEELISQIELNEEYTKLARIAGRVWKSIEDALAVPRLRRYT